MPEPMFVVTDVAPYVTGPAGVHGVLGQAATAMRELAVIAGLEPVVVSSVADVAPFELDRGGVLALFTIGETPFSPEQRSAIVGGWRAGRLGVLGIHSATDACRRWDDYGMLLGARFDGHPWTQSFRVHVEAADHPATEHFQSTWDWHDEVYLFRDLRPECRILLRLDDGQLDMSAPGARTPECGFPLAWALADGHGRTFYSALGHFAAAWENPTYLRHLAGGLEWLRDRAQATADG